MRQDGRAAKRQVGTRRKPKVKARQRSGGRAALPPIAKILRRLDAEYPNAHCELHYRTPFELLVATILSAQCTDARVNMVTPALFSRYPTARALADADPEELQEMIRSTGFFRNKTKSLLGMARAVVETHGGTVPADMVALRMLPGVGRKTANVVLGNAFDINEGITVDTHVTRVANRLGLTRETDPLKIERDLMKLVPRDQWTLVSHWLIWHGRRVCIARRPRCPDCVLNDLCPSAQLDGVGKLGRH